MKRIMSRGGRDSSITDQKKGEKLKKTAAASLNTSVHRRETKKPLRSSFKDEKSLEFSLDGDSTSASDEDENDDRRTKTTIEFNLEQLLEASSALLKARQDESSLTQREVAMALGTYHELQRVLSLPTRTGDWMSRPTATAVGAEQSYDQKYDNMLEEFETADKVLQQTLASHPAMTRPLSLSVIEHDVTRDLFILDNSLRETTVGAPKGHSLEEKYQILKAMAGTTTTNDSTEGQFGSVDTTTTGIKEIILGSFGSKISVDSQIAERWKALGQSFDSAWGFSDAYDMESYDEKPLWDALPEFLHSAKSGKAGAESFHFVTPPAQPLTKYSKQDVALLEKASKGFRKDAFGGKKLQQVLKESVSKQYGRVPLGFIMMAGYGICNAIVEVDTTLETFDYSKYNVVERCKFLLQWCKNNLPERQSFTDDDNSPRILINLRDFTNFQRTASGLKNALHLVDALSRLPAHIRPLGFMMEEPSGWLLPDEVGKLCRMVRLTMQRAGFPQGRFLVHIHMSFGMADATQLACLANGADGIWAAVSRTGAQVGHACSTITAVNLFRLGHHQIAKQYNLAQMVGAARTVTEITTRQPCPTHEECYGTLAFDIPYVMTNLPACRYTLALLVEELQIERTVRLNELSSPYAVQMAMQQQFGSDAGWDPQVCPLMWDAIHNHLLTGLSRDYNSKIGLGHLYGLASQKALPSKMVAIMMEDSIVPDTHPTILEFVQRWNRLCLDYEGKELPPHDSLQSKSIMLWNTDWATAPLRATLPFEYYKADHIRSPGHRQLPKLLRMHMLKNVVKDEAKVQRRRRPVVNFYDAVMRLKLFVQEANHKGFWPLVDDFLLQRGLEVMFDDEYAWLQDKRGIQHNTLRKATFSMLRQHLGGKLLELVKREQTKNTAFRRMAVFMERRLLENQEVGADLQAIRKTLVKLHHLRAIPGHDDNDAMGSSQIDETSRVMNSAHIRIMKELEEEGDIDDANDNDTVNDGALERLSQEIVDAFLVLEKNSEAAEDVNFGKENGNVKTEAATTMKDNLAQSVTSNSSAEGPKPTANNVQTTTITWIADDEVSL